MVNCTSDIMFLLFTFMRCWVVGNITKVVPVCAEILRSTALVSVAPFDICSSSYMIATSIFPSINMPYLFVAYLTTLLQ
jgi:hypothetical protein